MCFVCWQPFRCVPGTHLAMPSWKAVGTFEPVRDPVLLARYAAEMVEVTILPGCAIVFYQHIVHEVAKPKRALVADSYRFMCGLLLTRESKRGVFPLTFFLRLFL